MSKSSTGLSENVASALCYVGLFVTGIVFLIIEQENRVVKFNALQSLITFAALGILGTVVRLAFSWVPFIGGPIAWLLCGAIGLVTFALAAYLFIMSLTGNDTVKLPIIGDICWEQVNK